MTDYPRNVAVVTGDLALSTELGSGAVDAIFAALAHYVAENAHWIGDSFTRQSGDGWQILVPYPQHGLRSALAIRAFLKSQNGDVETYISIAEGRLDAPPPRDLNQTNEEIFVRSGRELTILKERAKRDGILLAHWDFGPAASVGYLADHISQSWTPPQAQAMALYLDPYAADLSYTEAADALGKSRQAVTKSLKAAGKDALLKALFTLEASFPGTR